MMGNLSQAWIIRKEIVSIIVVFTLGVPQKAFFQKAMVGACTLGPESLH